MRLVSKFSMSLLALAFMSSISLAGEIKGTVTGKDGQPAADVPVRLMKAAGAQKKGDAKAPAAAPADKKPAAGEKKPGANKPLQQTKTGADGAFAFTNVEDGAYRVQAGNKEAGMGGKAIKVEAGKSETVSIKLAEPKAKAPK